MSLRWLSTAVHQAQPEVASVVDEVAEERLSPLSSTITRRQASLLKATFAVLLTGAKAAVVLRPMLTVACSSLIHPDPLTTALTCLTQTSVTLAPPTCRPQ